MNSIETFERLVAEALAQEFEGWNFKYLNGRWQAGSLPWDYRAAVLEAKKQAAAMLDIGTGGGEFLASLAPFPAITWAAEGYPPNIAVARRRLSPLGVQVAEMGSGDQPWLPFSDQTFDLVIDRHEGYRASEVFRVLKPGGHYISQQVGGENCMGINRALQAVPSAPYQFWTMAYEVDHLNQAGFKIEHAEEAFPPLAFYDIGALVFYLKIITWQIEDFSVERYRNQLLDIHRHIEAKGEFVVLEHRIFVKAMRVS
jgi:SAM-dependent methyltransferase